VNFKETAKILGYRRCKPEHFCLVKRIEIASKIKIYIFSHPEYLRNLSSTSISAANMTMYLRRDTLALPWAVNPWGIAMLLKLEEYT